MLKGRDVGEIHPGARREGLEMHGSWGHGALQQSAAECTGMTAGAAEAMASRVTQPVIGIADLHDLHDLHVHVNHVIPM